MSDKRANKLDPAVALAHELGHLAFAWAKMMGPSKAAAVHLENEARKIRDPNGPTRIRHEWDEPKVVDTRVHIPVRGLSNWPKWISKGQKKGFDWVGVTASSSDDS